MNVNERNQDVIDILRKVNFGRQLGIPQNNHIIWSVATYLSALPFSSRPPHPPTLTPIPLPAGGAT